MTETELSDNDKLRLREDIKASTVIGLIFLIALVALLGLIIGIMFLFGTRPSDDFITRCLFILAFLLIPFLVMSWTNVLKYLDIRKGKKLIYKSNNYEILHKKDTVYILTKDENPLKIEIDDELVQFINKSQYLTMEISVLAKSLLFISHDNNNLLDKLYIDDNG